LGSEAYGSVYKSVALCACGHAKLFDTPYRIACFARRCMSSMVSLLLLATARAAAAVLALATLGECKTFYSALENCPEPCVAGAEPSSWTVYNSVKHLSWCNQTMLVDFSVYSPLDSPGFHQPIRACTTNATPQAVSKAAVSTEKSYQGKGEVQLIAADTSAVTINKDDALAAVEHLQGYLANNKPGTPSAYTYSGSAAVGVYLGPGIQNRDAAATLVQKLLDQVKSQAVTSNTLLQLCGSDRDSDEAFGVVLDSASNLPSIQKAIRSWSDAECATGYKGKEARTNVDILMKAPTPVARVGSSG
jgi:chitinase